MLRPLLLLSAAALVRGFSQTVTVATTINLTDCPITFYGKTYTTIEATPNVRLGFNDNYLRAHDAFGRYFSSPSITAYNVSVEKGDEASVDSRIRASFPAFTLGPMLCYLRFDFTWTVPATLYLASYGAQSFLMLNYSGPTSLGHINVYGGNIKKGELHASSAGDPVDVLDTSGCLYDGQRYGRNQSDNIPYKCTNLTCSVNAELTVSGCRRTQGCQGDHICATDTHTCTITGPAVIDISGSPKTVKDRCVYRLLASSSPTDVEVVAKFQNRRRKDVSFLESVMLKVDNGSHHIHLEQGGRVRVNDLLVALNSMAQEFHTVMLSKDQSGVTAEFWLAGQKTIVFFDGFTAQIHVKGAYIPTLDGLCGNNGSALGDVTLLDISDSSCWDRHSEPDDVTINCTAVTERCQRLHQEPFADCGTEINPQPHIDACSQTLCKYPALDGLDCQFLKAFAQVCSVSGIPLQDWRADVSCCPPEIFCQDRTCSDHEFCGEKTPGGDTRCFCRPLFASKYNNTLGEPTSCSQDSGQVSVSLVGCLLEDKGIDYSALHLNDGTCRGQFDKLTHMVTFRYNNSNTCGAEVTTINNQIIFTNTIMTQNISGVITRQDQVNINFSCIHTLPEMQTTFFRIKDSSVIQNITSGAWNYTLTMMAYSDGGLSQALSPNTAVQLNQKIWVELDTAGLEGGLVALVTDSCWATKDKPSNSSVRHDLITGGCADSGDNTVAVTGNGLGTSNSFSFNMFQFSGSSGDVYLHCKLELCVKTNKSCKPNCSPAKRRRRSDRSRSAGEATAFISMVWAN